MRRNKLVMETKRSERKCSDRGDVRRVLRIPTVKLDIETQISEGFIGGGDSLLKESSKELPQGPQRQSHPQHGTNETSNEPKLNRKTLQTNDKRQGNVKPLSIAQRRELAQRYTFKWYEEPKELIKKEELNPKHEKVVTLDTEDAQNLNKSNEKRAVIKTVTQKGDSITVYKAVTFEKNKKSIPLQVNLPAKVSPPSSPHSSSKSSRSNKSLGLRKHMNVERNYRTVYPMISTPLKTTVSPTNIPMLTARNKSSKSRSRNRRKRTSSPELASPPSMLTESAKWKPETVNTHTKPYYEAWVNTTLSAISRNSDPKTLMEKRQIIKQFQKTLENAPPVLTEEDMTDERYAGKIRVRRRNEMY